MEFVTETLVNLTIDKKYKEIIGILNELPTKEKGGVFECYIEELHRGNGWLTKRNGGSGDSGADILLYHPSTPTEVSLIIQVRNQNKPLSFDGTKIELIKFEEEASLRYHCKDYILISLNGFVQRANELSGFKMKLESWNYICTLIDGYEKETVQSPKIELFAHNKVNT